MRKVNSGEGDSDSDLVTCPSCGCSTPAENLNCIYCGESLNRPVGLISGLGGSQKSLSALILFFLLVILLIVWLS